MYRRTGGFTLIEIMVVLVIMAIAATIAVPYVANTSSTKLSSAGRMVMSDLFYAQNVAITNQSPVTITFYMGDATKGTGYAVTDSTGALVHAPDNQDMNRRFVQSSSDLYRQTTIQSLKFENTTSTTGTITMQFSPLGEPQTSAGASLSYPVTLTLKMASGTSTATLQLIIQPATGEISAP